MLQSLRIKNFALVENACIEFERGLNVVTGETGAGKSILMNALGLALGERADKNMIRAGEEHCCVEAVFQFTDSSSIDTLLEELGIDACEEGRLIIRRVVSESGAGKMLVNDNPVTLHSLRRIGNLLVDMHGPHEHQSLLDPDFQRDLLDSFGHLWKFRSAYEECYRRRQALLRRRKELETDGEDVTDQIAMLSFQIKEIAEAHLREGEDEELEREHTLVANAQRIIELGMATRNALTEDEHSAFNALVVARNAVTQLTDLLEQATNWRKEVEAAAVQIQEVSDTIDKTLQAVNCDPQRLQSIEDRMAMIHKLKRKYGPTIRAILAAQEKASQRLRELETRGDQLAAVDAELATVVAQMEATGRKLREERRKVARSLGDAITAELRDLGFPHGRFAVSVTDTEPGPSGMDAVEFGFAPNLGEPMRPLRLIASSGEISRVMLAAKAVLAAHDRIAVLVFDEIDANVGGELGKAVGAKLARVARTHQVICITHLPQVAVHGTAHYLVTKEVHDGRTRTLIQRMKNEERVEEIARMLGGKDITATALRHAREMLRTSGSSELRSPRE
ncbi:MAG: DNA repair protein RecN [Kiritimatiellae bacterium]|nr:DNA repair protein RecN [Kiritimatiellia bacterium]